MRRNVPPSIDEPRGLPAKPRTSNVSATRPGAAKDNVSGTFGAAKALCFWARIPPRRISGATFCAYVTRTLVSNVPPYVYAMKMSVMKPKEMTR